MWTWNLEDTTSYIVCNRIALAEVLQYHSGGDRHPERHWMPVFTVMTECPMGTCFCGAILRILTHETTKREEETDGES
jgi:hypothetical protein